ncbi:MAG: hypothetical protein GVY32_07890, partial [Gammaproteobacteria bacterium]|nr:hypothetical protein [Gammaproteobacteria bacterium]
ANQPTSQPANQPTSQPANQPTRHHSEPYLRRSPPNVWTYSLTCGTLAVLSGQEPEWLPFSSSTGRI